MGRLIGVDRSIRRRLLIRSVYIRRIDQPNDRPVGLTPDRQPSGGNMGKIDFFDADEILTRPPPARTALPAIRRLTCLAVAPSTNGNSYPAWSRSSGTTSLPRPSRTWPGSGSAPRATKSRSVVFRLPICSGDFFHEFDLETRIFVGWGSLHAAKVRPPPRSCHGGRHLLPQTALLHHSAPIG